jgi:5-methylcytosine-specific restriction endonuclease McrA
MTILTGRTRTAWTDDELARLRLRFKEATWSELLAEFAPHTRKSIIAKGLEFGIKRYKPGRTPEQYLQAKREFMRRYRATADGLAAQRRAYRKHYYEGGGKEQQRLRISRLRKRHFFEYRALILVGKDATITPIGLLQLWRAQCGRCALTGMKLGRNAHLDHKLPRKRGGATTLANLQWVTPQANHAKRNYTVEEFVAICRQVVAFLGK